MALWSKKSKDGGAADAGDAPATPPALTAASPAPSAAVAAPAAKPGAAAAAPPLDAEEAKKRAAVSKHLLLSFGEIVSVLMRSPQFRAMPLTEVEALVVPAVMSGQFLVAEAQSKTKGFVTPVAIALWATVSREVDQRLALELGPLDIVEIAQCVGRQPWIVVRM